MEGKTRFINMIDISQNRPSLRTKTFTATLTREADTVGDGQIRRRLSSRNVLIPWLPVHA